LTDTPIDHAQFSLNRTLSAAPATVFAAWSDPDARACWGPPSKRHRMVFDQTEFREGGVDISHCGMDEDLSFRVVTRYEHIQPNQRLVFTESVSRQNHLLSVSLITLELTRQDEATALSLTVQMTSLVGEGMIDGTKTGYESALRNLEPYLADVSGPA